MALRDYLAEEVTQDFSDGLLTRREAIRRLGLLGMGVAAATTLLACADDDGDAATSPPREPGPSPTTSPAVSGPAAETIRFAGPSGEVQGAWASPSGPRASVLVVHENRGLTPHFSSLVSRLAGEGYAALCVDLVSPEGGTASLSDPAAAMGILGDTPLERLLGDLRAGIDELARRSPGTKIGAVGFCFGGGMVWNLLNAGEARLAAAAPFYGPAPENADFHRARAAVLAVYAERDTRINATRDRAEAALKAAGLVYEIRTFAGADHAFFNETGPRYHEQAAREAYAALLDWFRRHLA